MKTEMILRMPHVGTNGSRCDMHWSTMLAGSGTYVWVISIKRVRRPSVFGSFAAVNVAVAT
jgi:hypothetical protein